MSIIIVILVITIQFNYLETISSNFNLNTSTSVELIQNYFCIDAFTIIETSAYQLRTIRL